MPKRIKKNVVKSKTRNKLDAKKSPYNMVVGQQESIGNNVMGQVRSSQFKMSHCQLKNLIIQSMDLKTANYFSTLFSQLRLQKDNSDSEFPLEPPDFIPSTMKQEFKDCYISKTPAWVVAYCLSILPGNKRYSLSTSNVESLSSASDNAYLLCGLYNTDDDI